ncbi:UNVERIFIED_CONTAM: putative inactive ATP-dependent zinc metalloprotease FTSHI 5, chloroplastic [Sesamum latifolium]|uniref:Inactive ATP-dependent zinc metalloprotease FTSHI 5, chloroplastic n=1 Tax=Sesamum latifolium TaxID=2727402 RepID=A0AAW2WXT7_9LAMI
MENSNAKADDDNTTTIAADAQQNPTDNPQNAGDGAGNRRQRTPFTDLSQVDADLALARTLQEQERAYMMLRMDIANGSDYGSWEADSYGHEDEADDDDFDDASEEDYDGSDVEVDDDAEDAFDVHAHAEEAEDNQNAELDPSAFSSDEAYARALQDAEEREMAARLLALAGINGMVVGEDEEEELDEHDGNPQDAWEEVDPDELSYEELLALGDVVGTESRGLSADTIASLPSINYKSQGIQEGSNDSFVLYAVLKSPLQEKASTLIQQGAAALRVVRCSVDDNKVDNRPGIISNDLKHSNDEHNALAVARPIAYALFCVVIGFFCPVFGFRKPALAAVAAAPPAAASELVLGDENEIKGHEYSRYTRRLLEDVSRLLRLIKEGKNAGKEDFVTNVEEGLNQVKMTKSALQEKIMNGLHAELETLKGEKEELMDRSEKILDKVSKALREEENLLRNGKGAGDRIERLKDERMSWEKKYNDILERIWDIEDLIAWKETMAFSIGVRELLFIERECETLVEDFLREMRRPKIQSVSGPAVTKLSKGEIRKELQDAHRQLQEQIILPSVVVNGDMESLSGQDSTDFALRIQKALRDSREMQKNLESQIRKTMKKHGEERRFIAITPPDEVVKGYPDIELKWMFGRKEVVSGKAASLHLLHGWKKWREDVKMDLKKSFLEDPELGKKYVAERQALHLPEEGGRVWVLFGNLDYQERILWDRDRVASRTWYNEQQNRWELDPIAVPYAISKKLVENARIRHDWAAMYVTLKGNDEEYFVDVKELEMLFEDFGGFDALYLRMVAAGIPTSVQLMWIPFSELDFSQQFLLLVNLCRQCFTELWRSNIVSYAKEWTLEKIRNINDDIMVMIVFPLVEFVIPYQVRMRLGMAWPEYADVSVGSTWYLKWQSEAEIEFKSRKRNGFRWHFMFLVRTAIYGYVLFHVFRFLRRKVPRVLGFGPLRRNPNLRKLRRVKAYLRYRRKKIKRRKKDGVDPISTAFENMKRIKNPPIRLKDFASVESMREEINEVVAFLQNPNAFQEMGARAPRVMEPRSAFGRIFAR